ncbi:putative pyrimidine 5'-nucleotidase [Hamiltosporidium magnivora]|uniref:Putative pyrimidine 5'-nucleotidase n=1 Tax=Hamiltosporidium magnivora TaxID=148818 RepID=A0A4Q9LID9_9MICR|nr:putative pyrimidine 5'-nucleotidase [Hamiltosporidium magnivora]
MQILLWIIFVKFSKENSEIQTYYNMITEMKSNPIVFHVSALFIHFLNHKTFGTIKTELIVRTPISKQVNFEVLKEYIESLELTKNNLTSNELEMLCFTTYFKKRQSFKWLLVFRTRIIYVVFSKFKNIFKEYFPNFNTQSEFAKYMYFFISEYYTYDDQTDNDILEIQEEEKDIVLKDLKEILKPCSINTIFTSGCKERKELNLDSNYDTSNIYERLFSNTNSEFNIKDITQYTIKYDQNTPCENHIDMMFAEFKNSILQHAKSCSAAHVFYSNMIELFSSIFRNYYALSYHENICKEYFNEDILNAYSQILKQRDEQANKMIFNNYYKILFTYLEDHLNKLLSYVTTKPFLEFENISCFLKEFIWNPEYSSALRVGPFYVCLSLNPIKSMFYNEKVLVFDIDDTLFPTELFQAHFNKYEYGFDYTAPDQPLKSFMIQFIQNTKEYNESKCKELVGNFFCKEKNSSLFSIQSHLAFLEEFKQELQDLKAKKIFFTNATQYHAEYILKQMNLVDCFDHVVHREIAYIDSTILKPKYQAYEFVENFLGTSPSNIYFYDNMLKNIVEANNRGWNAFLVQESLIKVLRESLVGVLE